jgi:hypothetical protein
MSSPPAVSSLTFHAPGEGQALVLPWIFASVDYLGTRKLLGEKAECAFVYQAMEHGLIVSKPYGDSAAYDFVVERREAHRRGRREEPARAGRAKTTATRETNPGGRRGKLWKIQVKSVQNKDPMGRYSVNLRKSFSRRYERGEIDFFAVWVIGAATWYIVPGSEVFPAKGGHFYPDVRGSRGKYERYREAWELLKN